MVVKKFGVWLAVSVLLGCGEEMSGERKSGERGSEVIGDKKEWHDGIQEGVRNYNLAFNSGKEIQIQAISKSASLNDIIISSSGFEFGLNDTLRDKDPVISTFVSDLDSNGYEEFYVITRSAGSGSYGKVIGYSSNRDISITPIYFVNDKPSELETKPLYGYMGHDSYSIHDGFLIREYPIYLQADPNSSPSGQKRRIYYKLIQGEASWQLRSFKWERVDLE